MPSDSEAAAVRDRIAAIGKNIPFSTKELLLSFVSATVYKQLSLLSRAGMIQRLARGVYIDGSPDAPLPSANEIAQVKAERFGKKAFSSQEKIFRTDGCKSSFDSVQGRIEFKHMAPRKLKEISLYRAERVKTKIVEFMTRNPQEELSDSWNEELLGGRFCGEKQTMQNQDSGKEMHTTCNAEKLSVTVLRLASRMLHLTLSLLQKTEPDQNCLASG